MKRKAVLSVFTLALSLVLALCACGKQQEVKKSATDVAATAKQIADNTYLVRAGEEDTVTAEDAEVKSYDISVTSFNVGGFAAGVDTGINTSHEGWYSPADALSRWKVLLDYDNNYANHYFDSDVYGLQEFTDLFYEDDAEGGTGEIIMTADVFKNVFNSYETYVGKTHNGDWTMYMGLTTSNKSNYTIHNVSYGQISGKDSLNTRSYMKGYVTVNGIEVAVYTFHNSFYGSAEAVADQYYEIIELMNQDEYCIVTGDMNSTCIAEYVGAAGYKYVNMSEEYGNINTCVNGDGKKYIDNIFVSPNIDIVYAECAALEEDFLRGYSDHRPLTAYLKINPDAAGVTASTVEIGSDGYTTEYR